MRLQVENWTGAVGWKPIHPSQATGRTARCRKRGSTQDAATFASAEIISTSWTHQSHRFRSPGHDAEAAPPSSQNQASYEAARRERGGAIEEADRVVDKGERASTEMAAEGSQVSPSVSVQRDRARRAEQVNELTPLVGQLGTAQKRIKTAAGAGRRDRDTPTWWIRSRACSLRCTSAIPDYPRAATN